MSNKRQREEEETSCKCKKRVRQNTSTTSCSKSVTWSCESPTVHVFNKHIQPYKSDIWYSRDDFKRFQIERFLTVQVFQQVAAGDGTPLDADLVCFRGFEAYRSRESLRRYQQGRLAHTACIIQEQGFQRILGLHDPDRLRLLATMKSQSYLQEAQTRAALDELAVNPKSCLYKNESSLFSSHSLEVESPAEFVKFEVVTTNCIGTDLSPQQIAIRAA